MVAYVQFLETLLPERVVVELLPSALLTLEEVKTYLKRADTVDDEVLARLINYATGQIERWCRRRLKRRAYNPSGVGYMVLSGSGRPELWLSEYPVHVLTSVSELMPDGSARALTITGYRLSPRGTLYLPQAGFSSGYRNIQVDCEAGLDNLLDAEQWSGLTGAALRYVQVLWQDHDSGIGRGTGISVEGESLNLIDAAIPRDVERALQPFQRIL